MGLQSGANPSLALTHQGRLTVNYQHVASACISRGMCFEPASMCCRYADGLADAVVKAGGQIFERSRVRAPSTSTCTTIEGHNVGFINS